MKKIITGGPMDVILDQVRTIKKSSNGRLGFEFAKQLVNIVDNIVYIHSPDGLFIKNVNVKLISSK